MHETPSELPGERQEPPHQCLARRRVAVLAVMDQQRPLADLAHRGHCRRHGAGGGRSVSYLTIEGGIELVEWLLTSPATPLRATEPGRPEWTDRDEGRTPRAGSSTLKRPHDVRELAPQRRVLRLEQLVWHVRRLKHREAVGRAAIGQLDSARREHGHAVLRGAGEHVDDPGCRVGPDREEELAEPVDDLVVVALAAQLSGELGCPFRQVLDVGHVLEDRLPRRSQHGGDGGASHSSITPFSARTSASRFRVPSDCASVASSSPRTCSATARKARPRAVRRTLKARPSPGSRSRATRPSASQCLTSPVIACLDSRDAAASSPSRRPSRSKSGTSTEPYDARTSPNPRAAKRSTSSSLTCWDALARRNPTCSRVADDSV